MKCLNKVVLILLILPTLTFAGWQVSKPSAAIPSQPFFQAGTQQDTTFMPTSIALSSHHPLLSKKFANLGRPAAVYAISVSGSLKENLERIMRRYRWKIIWKSPYDYNFDGRVTGASLPDVVEKILKPFPLKATLYMSNRIMIVTPRTY